ncbi:hypothetical protein [Nocardia sp. NBC_00403]|uniref:hypothetical protein n=1 Tax=Nocardia sp. NBC_00403 TaxID=2975990 RepID=UPI002E239B4F
MVEELCGLLLRHALQRLLCQRPLLLGVGGKPLDMGTELAHDRADLAQRPRFLLREPAREQRQLERRRN